MSRVVMKKKQLMTNELKDFREKTVWDDGMVSILPFTVREAELIVSSEQQE